MRPEPLTSGAAWENNREVARLGMVTLVVILALTAAEPGFGARPLPLTVRAAACADLHDSGILPCGLPTSGYAVSNIRVGRLAAPGRVRCCGSRATGVSDGQPGRALMGDGARLFGWCEVRTREGGTQRRKSRSRVSIRCGWDPFCLCLPSGHQHERWRQHFVFRRTIPLLRRRWLERGR